jgi:hypothetical protein
MSDPAKPIDTAEPTQTAIKCFQSSHIHASGRRCRSASLRGEQFCCYRNTCWLRSTSSTATKPSRSA